MSKVIVDTTILVNALTKTKAVRDESRQSISAASVARLPVYAIKEFGKGFIQYAVWFHNRIVVSTSMAEVYRAIHSVHRNPSRVGAALELLAQAADDYSNQTSDELIDTYGVPAHQEQIQLAQLRLFARRKAESGWKRRRSLDCHVICNLDCFDENPITMKLNGQLTPVNSCNIRLNGCSMAKVMSQDRARVRTLRDASGEIGDEESSKRAKILDKVARRIVDLSHSECRNLGDAVFSFLASDDFKVLTTNLKHHAPLADAVGSEAIVPTDVTKGGVSPST